MPRGRNTTSRPPRRGSVQQLPSGSWRARVTVPGTGARLTLGSFTTEREAWGAIDVHVLSGAQGLWQENAATRTPLRDVWRAYILMNPTESGNVERWRNRFDRSVLTGESVASCGRIILGAVPVGQVTEALLRQWVTSLRSGGLAPATIRAWWGEVSRTLDYAARQRMIRENPVAGVSALPRGALARAARHPHFLTLAESVALVEAANERWADLFEVLLWCGLRQGEARALTGNALDPATSALWVRASIAEGPDRVPYSKGPKTAAGIRRVPVPPPLIAKLTARAVADDVPLFPAPISGTWEREVRLNEAWARYRAACGLIGDPNDPVPGRRHAPTPHDARKTVASRLFALGAALPEVAAWLGHSDPSVTLGIYSASQDLTATDPVYPAIRNESLPLAEAWARLYDEAHRLHAHRGVPVTD